MREYLIAMEQERRLVLTESSASALEVFDLCIEHLQESYCRNPEIISEAVLELDSYLKTGVKVMIERIKDMAEQVILLLDNFITHNNAIIAMNSDQILRLAEKAASLNTDTRFTMYDLKRFDQYPKNPKLNSYIIELDDVIIENHLRNFKSLDSLFMDNLYLLIKELYESNVPFQGQTIREFDIQQFKKDINSFTQKTRSEIMNKKTAEEILDFAKSFKELRTEVRLERNAAINNMNKIRENAAASIKILDQEKLAAFVRKNLADTNSIKLTPEYAQLMRDIEAYYTTMTNIVYQSYMTKFIGYKTILGVYHDNLQVMVQETRMIKR